MAPANEEIFFGHGGQLRSGFGTQTLGRDPSAPIFGFGSSNRDAGLKLYASADHDKAKVRSSGGNQSQGAVYRVEVRTQSTCAYADHMHAACSKPYACSLYRAEARMQSIRKQIVQG